MPGFNGTGPQGQGPMTGGGRGYCVTSAKDGISVGQGRGPLRDGSGRGIGGGLGRGQGRGAGIGRGQMAPVSDQAQVSLDKAEELTMLKSDMTELSAELQRISERISFLENDESK